MSKIDELMSFVDELDVKSTKLAGCVDRSQMYIDEINKMNQSILKSDSSFDEMAEALLQGTHFLQEFHSLNERSLYLESNIRFTDRITNSMSLECLQKEYNYTKGKYLDTYEPEYLYYEDFNDMYHEGLQSPSLNIKSSIADLKLKPIRCSSTKVEKKKSRYRLSSIYNFNPVVSEGTSDRFASIMDNEECTDATSECSIEKNHAKDQDPMNVFESTVIENVDHTSEGSISSLAEVEDPKFIDFEKFLRKSRINLRDAFPHILRSKSHDSVLSVDNPAPKEPKFHNPTQGIHLKSSGVVTPVVDPIYFNSSSPKSNMGVSRKILNEVIMKTSRAEAPQDKPQSLERRNSLDIVKNSFTESLMNFVNTPTKPHRTSVAPLGPISKTPEKIRHLKSRSKTNPIAIKLDEQIKRMPVRIPKLNDAHSSLTIGPNKTKIIKHGPYSISRRPIMSGVKRSSLQEALSQSLD